MPALSALFYRPTVSGQLFPWTLSSLSSCECIDQQSTPPAPGTSTKQGITIHELKRDDNHSPEVKKFKVQTPILPRKVAP